MRSCDLCRLMSADHKNWIPTGLRNSFSRLGVTIKSNKFSVILNLWSCLVPIVLFSGVKHCHQPIGESQEPQTGN